MIQNFRGKNIKDIEAASDTIVHNSELAANRRNKDKSINSISTGLQQMNTDNFDTFVEKKNKEH